MSPFILWRCRIQSHALAPSNSKDSGWNSLGSFSHPHPLPGQVAQQAMQHTPLIDSRDPQITPETVSRLPSSRRAPGPPPFGRRNDATFTPTGSSPNIRYNCALVCLPSFALPSPVSPSPGASVPGSTPTNMSTSRVGACCWPIPGIFFSAHRPL